jgi:PiT family inorganic phosphate transporter
MSGVMMTADLGGHASPRPHLDEKPHVGGLIAFFAVLLGGVTFAAYSISADMSVADEHGVAIGAFVLLGIALLNALVFEFVNGFHDSTNAVATAILRQIF